MNLTNAILSIGIVFFCFENAVAVGRDTPVDSYRNPSVYITKFDSKKISKNLRERFIFLQLHNNSKTEITLWMSGGYPKFGLTRLYFRLYDYQTGKTDYTNECRVCSFNRVAHGKAVPFYVEKVLVRDGVQLRIRYEYPQDEEYEGLMSKPLNFATFELSESLLKEEKPSKKEAG